MGVCSAKTVKGSALNCISIRKQPTEEEWSAIVNSKRTAVPRLQPVDSNPLRARRKANFQSKFNALRSSSGLETFSGSGQFDSVPGDVEGSQEALAT